MEMKFRTLNADEIDCRLAQVAKTGSGMFLLYKDARCDMAMLDEVVGPMNWKREHTRENANCIVSIWDDDKKQWISKEDTGSESNTEKEKGLASDSFKRACFNWGIGRELYTAPTIWVKPLQGEDIKYLRLKCTKIGYNDKREITILELVDGNGTVRYKFGSGKVEQQPQFTEEQRQMRDVALKEVATAISLTGLEDIWRCNEWLQTDSEFKTAVINKKKELQK